MSEPDSPQISESSPAAHKEETQLISPADMLAKLTIGALVQVSAADNTIKYLTRLIGADSTRTLIMPLPTPKQLKKETVGVVYDDIFFPDRPFIMRLIVEGTVFAFRSEVIAINYTGCKLLLLSFPKTIQCQKLRRDARFPCALSAQVTIEEQTFNAVLVNISNGGCQLQFNKDHLTLDFQDIKNSKFSLTVRFSAENDNVTLPTTAMSVHKIDAQTLSLGLAFEQSEKTVNDYLESLQLGEMSELFL